MPEILCDIFCLLSDFMAKCCISFLDGLFLVKKKKATAYFVDIINIILFAIGRDKNQ